MKIHSLLLLGAVLLAACNSSGQEFPQEGEPSIDDSALMGPELKAPLVMSPLSGASGESFMLSGQAEPNTEIWWLAYNEYETPCLSANTDWKGGKNIPVDAEGNFSAELDTSFLSNTESNDILVLSVKPGERDLSTYTGEGDSCFPADYITGLVRITYSGASTL